MRELIHFSPEKAFVPSSEKSRDLVEKNEVSFVTDSETGKIIKIGNPGDVNQFLDAEKSKDKSLIITPENGGITLPGFTDGHHHLLYGTLDVIEAGYVFGAESKREIIESVKEQVKEGDPIIPKAILGHNTAVVPDIFRQDLDEASGERPVCLVDLSFHGARLNTKMLELVLEKAKEMQKSGRTFTGSVDKKTGQVTEGWAIFSLEVAESYYGVEKIADGMRNKLNEWISQGITGIHEMHPLSWQDVEATLLTRKNWQEEEKTEFPVRQFFMSPELMSQLRTNLKDLEARGLFDPNRDWKKLGFKLIADGSLGSRTAMVSSPYDNGTKGSEFHSLKDFNDALQMAKEMGINRIATHAIGDAAIRRALDVAKKWKKIAEEAKMDPGKFRIEHFELSKGLSKEATEVGAWIGPQPNFETDYVYRDRLGNRITQICPHAESIENGTQMIFGSDGMPSSALFGIWAATHHPDPKQRIKFTEALAAYSLMAADYEHETGHNPDFGRIAEGASADIVMINQQTLDKLLQGEGSPEEFSLMGEKTEIRDQKAKDLDAEIMKIYRQGKLVKEKP